MAECLRATEGTRCLECSGPRAVRRATAVHVNVRNTNGNS